MKIPPQSLLTRSLREKSWGEKAARILAASLVAVDPDKAIKDNLARVGSKLILRGREIDLERFSRIFLISLGKAAMTMAASAGDLIGDRLTEGHVLSKGGAANFPDQFGKVVRIYQGSHPVPGEDSQRASAEILSRLSAMREDDLVIVLVSGGSSALFTYPVGGISLPDLRETSQVLLSCGADIREINTIRKHLSRVKGGQLARHLQPARVLTLILSDVIGDPIDMVGSGPTAPDPTTYADAMAVINKYRLEDDLPGSVVTWLAQGQAGTHPETPKPGEACFGRVFNLVLASNQDALRGGAAQAHAEGLAARILPDALTGEASRAGRNLAAQLVELASKNAPHPRPSGLIAGGETTVTLTNTKRPGLGGRNLEVALSALPVLDGLENAALITLATDGEDGLTDAAGAVVTGDSLRRCLQLGLDPEEHLRRHDSYPVFRSLEDLLLTGPTGTNVNDLCFLLIF